MHIGLSTRVKNQMVECGGFPEGKPLGVLVYVRVDNIDVALEKIVNMGGKVIVPKSKENGNKMATFADPDGNLFGLYEYAKE